MNKPEMVNEVATRLDLTKEAATKIVETFFDPESGIIVSALKSGDEVKLHGFGIFSVLSRAARAGVNPKTGKKIKIGACKSPRFRTGSTLRATING